VLLLVLLVMFTLAMMRFALARARHGDVMTKMVGNMDQENTDLDGVLKEVTTLEKEKNV
jgi:hypothetical protein